MEDENEKIAQAIREATAELKRAIIVYTLFWLIAGVILYWILWSKL